MKTVTETSPFQNASFLNKMVTAESTEQVAQLICQQLCELTGALTSAYIAKRPNDEKPAALYVCPQERKGMVNTILSEKEFTDIVDNQSLLIERESNNVPMATLLETLGVESLLAMPISKDDQSQEALLLVDLPDTGKAPEITSMMEALGPSIALCFANCEAHQVILEQNYLLESRVLERTRNLATKNKELNEARLAALNMMQDAVIAEKKTQQAYSDLKVANKALEDSRLEAEAASAAKSDFLAMMIHELRTPLNPIISLSEMLLDEEEDELNVSYLEAIRDGGAHLLEIIQDILDYVGQDPVRNQPHIERFPLSDFIDQIHKLVSPQVAKKSLTLQVEAASSAPATLKTDRLRLKRVILKLLFNAVKFTEQGSITLRVSGTGDGVRFEVQDTGIGISAEAQKHLFEPFMQQDSSAKRKFEGTGLGLAIAHKITSLLGGTIRITSGQGRGTQCRVDLPMLPPSIDSGTNER